MFRPNLGYRLRQVAFFTLVTFCFLVFIVIVLVQNGIGVGARWATTLNENDFLPRRTGELRASVRNIFGDPVPGAHVSIGGLEAASTSDGTVTMIDIPIGLHEMKIRADAYHDYSIRLRINEGANSPLIKYDLGLWPRGFAVDFHAFYANASEDEQRVFLQVGMANGSEQPIYVREFHTLDRTGQHVAPLLSTPDAYRRLALMHTALSLATEPYALVLQPKGIVQIELPPLLSIPGQGDHFTLVIRFGTHDEHRRGAYQTREIVADLQWEPDLSPHRP